MTGIKEVRAVAGMFCFEGSSAGAVVSFPSTTFSIYHTTDGPFGQIELSKEGIPAGEVVKSVLS